MGGAGTPWRVTLQHDRVGLRPIAYTDKRAWSEVRRRNAAWLRPWEASVPPGDRNAPTSFRGLVRYLRRQARAQRALPFALTVDGRFAGQVTVTNIVGGSARWAQVGYWIDRRYAGQNIMPLAVALVIDYCLQVLGLHRVEVAIRPENTASLRVVEKLGLTEVGYAKGYLHIDGAWRDHRLFAVTREESPHGLLRPFLESRPSP